jgi:hypothetical protein
MHTGLWRKEKVKIGDLEDLGIDDRVLFNSSRRNRIASCGLDSSGSGQVTSDELLLTRKLKLWFFS